MIYVPAKFATAAGRFLAALESAANGETRVIRSIPEICADADLGESTAWRVKRQLIKDGYIISEPRFDMSKPKGHRAQWANEYILRPTPEQIALDKERLARVQAARKAARQRNLRFLTAAAMTFMIDSRSLPEMSAQAASIALASVTRWSGKATQHPPIPNYSPKAVPSVMSELTSSQISLAGFYERRAAARKKPGG